MKTAATICFVLAVLTAIAATKNLFVAENRPEEVENLVGYAVGGYLVPIALLIVGLILRDKAAKKTQE